MRKIHHYQTIRYFPHLLSDEFVNVGVVLNTSREISRVLSVEEAKHLHCSALIGDKKKFLGVVEYLNKLADENRLLENNHYLHNFRFGEERSIASQKSAQEVVDELFDDYIGYKLQTQEKQDAKTLILEKSIQIAQSNSFRRYVRVRTEISSQFDFEIESIQKQIVHHSIVGKTTLKHDVTRMVMATPDHKEKQNRYDFLNMGGEIDPENPYVKKLEHNFVDPYPYKTDVQIAEYLEQIAS